MRCRLEYDGDDLKKLGQPIPPNIIIASSRELLPGELHPLYGFDITNTQVDGDAGTCDDMGVYHAATFLGYPEKRAKIYYRRCVLLYMKGELIGSLKYKGGKTMLALRDVYDRQGNLVLKMGAVYALRSGVVEGLAPLVNRGRDGWARQEVERLDVEEISEHMAFTDPRQITRAIKARTTSLLRQAIERGGIPVKFVTSNQSEVVDKQR